MLTFKQFAERVNFNPSGFQQRSMDRKDPRDNKSARQKTKELSAKKNLDRNLRKTNEEAPANATGAAVVGTGDNEVHWDNKKRKILRRKG